jgi:hypothetical protein
MLAFFAIDGISGERSVGARRRTSRLRLRHAAANAPRAQFDAKTRAIRAHDEKIVAAALKSEIELE